MSIEYTVLSTLIDTYEIKEIWPNESITYRGISLVKDEHSGESIEGANTLWVSLKDNSIVFSYVKYDKFGEDCGEVWNKTFSIENIKLKFLKKTGIKQ